MKNTGGHQTRVALNDLKNRLNYGVSRAAVNRQWRHRLLADVHEGWRWTFWTLFPT